MKTFSRTNAAYAGAESWRGHFTRLLAGRSKNLNHRTPVPKPKRAGRAITHDDWQDFQQVKLTRGGGDNGAVQFGLLGNPCGV